MDRKQVLGWLAGIVARGLAWVFAGKLGIDAAQADTWGAAAGEAVASLVLIGVSVYTSVKGRRKLLSAPPPETAR